MINIFKKLLLNREAVLFDSHLYILKGFLGVLTGYLLFETHPFIGRDMISLLFGMMLTLEPVNTTGIKSGFNQMKASLVGGLTTAIIVGIFGIHFLTVAIAMAVTMYVSLLIDWKSILPVAMFTSIYMTQVIQYTAAGEPSMLITLQLRFLSLGTGILIALIYNYLFSLVFYKSMFRKRVIFLLERTSALMKRYCQYLSEDHVEELTLLKREHPLIFGDIDFVYGHIADLSKQKKKQPDISIYHDVILEIRDLNYHFLDLIMKSLEEKDKNVAKDMLLIQKEINQIAYNLDRRMPFTGKEILCQYKNDDVRSVSKSACKIYHILSELME